MSLDMKLTTVTINADRPSVRGGAVDFFNCEHGEDAMMFGC